MEEETWRSEDPIVDREEREGDFVVLDEGEEEGEDDEEAFIGARGDCSWRKITRPS